MTTPIKPPGHGVPPTSTADVEKAHGPSSTTGPSESFKAALDRASPANAANPITGPDAIRALVDELRAGRLTVDGVLDKLVARALDSKTAQGLSPVQKSELAATLRNALLDDPNLGALTKDLAKLSNEGSE